MGTSRHQKTVGRIIWPGAPACSHQTQSSTHEKAFNTSRFDDNGHETTKTTTTTTKQQQQQQQPLKKNEEPSSANDVNSYSQEL